MTRNEAYTFDRHYIGRLAVHSTTPAAAVREVMNNTLIGPAAHFHLVNAYSTVCAAESPQVAQSLREGAINFPDGKPLYWIGHILRQDQKFNQVRGPELFENVIKHSNSEVRHFFMGSTPEVLNRLVINLQALNANVKIAGVDSPPFVTAGRAEWDRRNRVIRESGANIVWVGLGTPKQDIEARRLTEELGITSVAVGAAFDFSAGNVKEAPRWMRRAGLEWLYRLISEPRRLWRRYLLGNVKFIWLAIRHGRKA